MMMMTDCDGDALSPFPGRCAGHRLIMMMIVSTKLLECVGVTVGRWYG